MAVRRLSARRTLDLEGLKGERTPYSSDRASWIVCDWNCMAIAAVWVDSKLLHLEEGVSRRRRIRLPSAVKISALSSGLAQRRDVSFS